MQNSCAYDGYVNSIYTIAINGVNKDGSRPSYAEECPAIMATTYSSDMGEGIVSGMSQYSLQPKNRWKERKTAKATFERR